jgi:hypothetical protein
MGVVQLASTGLVVQSFRIARVTQCSGMIGSSLTHRAKSDAVCGAAEINGTSTMDLPSSGHPGTEIVKDVADHGDGRASHRRTELGT